MSIEDWELKDPEFIQLRRKLRLKALEIIFAKLARLEEQAAWWKEEAAKAVWVWEKLIKHVPSEIADQVFIDVDVAKDMDPGFTFFEAVSKMK